MDIALAFSYAFKDEEWLKKLGIGALIMLSAFLIIPLPILYGYMIAIIRNVANGEKRPLPDWDDVGKMFTEGWILVAVILVYSLPLIILYGIVIGAGIALTNSGSEELFVAMMSIAQCVGLVFSLVMALFGPAVLVQFAKHGTFSSCFELNEIYAFTRRNIGNVLLAWVTALAASLLMQIAVVVSVITICGPFIIMFAGYIWVMSVMGHVYGQIAAQDEGWGKSKEALYDDLAY